MGAHDFWALLGLFEGSETSGNGGDYEAGSRTPATRVLQHGSGAIRARHTAAGGRTARAGAASAGRVATAARPRWRCRLLLLQVRWTWTFTCKLWLGL